MITMLYILLALIVAGPLYRYLSKLPAFDTSKQEAVIEDEWNKRKFARSSH